MCKFAFLWKEHYALVLQSSKGEYSIAEKPTREHEKGQVVLAE